MLFILAPSKTMDMSSVDTKGNRVTTPHFQQGAEVIATVIQRHRYLDKLMHVSSALAEATRKKYQQWGEKTKPAMYAYVGDVYKGFYAKTLSGEDIEWAQKHLRIMSGLYGILRPLDRISPYRLEMKSRFSVKSEKDLYTFWGDTLAKAADAEADGVICILSSDEYAKPITKYSKSRIITPVFLDKKSDGTVGTVPIYSKMMRGVMARWVIDNRIEKPEDLEQFKAQGYRYDASRSLPNCPAFYRQIPKPIFYKK